MAIKLCDEYCEGCRYYRYFYEGEFACHYYYDTGLQRDCPAGKGCARRDELNKAERAEDLRARKELMLANGALGRRKRGV